MANREELAWVAGIVDGEGCIYILRTSNRYGSYTSSLTIRMVHMPTLRRVAEILGVGTVHHHKPIGNNRDVWQYRIYGKSAVEAIDSIREFLVTKRDEANLVCDIWNKFGSHADWNAIKERVSELKRYLFVVDSYATNVDMSEFDFSYNLPLFLP